MSHKDTGAKVSKTVSGIIQVTRKGVGYLPFENNEDIEIENVKMGGALNGDTVQVKLRGLFPRPTGEVLHILSRAKEEFVGTLKRNGTVMFVVPDDKKFYRSILLQKEPAFAEDEKVLVQLLSFDGKSDPVGVVLEHIGTSGEHRAEMNSIVLEHGFKTEFPEDVLHEAREIEKNHNKIIAEEVTKRSDFRDTPTFTIDPADAKDFDDALSIVELAGGEYEIGIHIADATFFVQPGTALEAETQRRGTSVYLVDTTIPMLPFELSAGVCSLKPNEDRLAFSAVFTMNMRGEVLSRRFEKTIIRSQKRFTYEEAQAVLDRGSAQHPLTSQAPQPGIASSQRNFATELGILRQIARTLKKKRDVEGAIDFGDNEVRFTLDEKGVPTGVVRKERLETMSLIEEFMLLANREVARHVSELAKKVPESAGIFLYRIHDLPKEDRIEELATFVRAVGFEFGQTGSKKKKYTAKDIARLLKDIEGKPEEHLIRTATLRSMAKAIYSTKNIGHFGLAFEYYTHFTSPIRRYPDMLVHRILASHLDKHPITKSEYGHLERLCIAASLREAEAVNAERESIKYKQVEYMLGKIGQTFEGVISGVTDWGLYVEEKTSAAEGLVRVRSLSDDFYNYSKKDYSLVGERTKKKFSLGDPARIKLVGADLSARTLDFELVR